MFLLKHDLIPDVALGPELVHASIVVDTRELGLAPGRRTDNWEEDVIAQYIGTKLKQVDRLYWRRES